VATVLPEMKANFPDVTLEDLITMSSGYEAEGDWPPADPGYLHGGSGTPFTPAATPQFAPGAAYSYWDSGTNVLGLALTEIAGESLKSVFERRIAGPVGMNPDAWDWRKFSETGGITVNGGSGNKGKHIEISAADLARFGHLMLNRGRWGERQLIGADWVAAATAVQVPADLPLGGPITDRYGERFPFDGRGVYGFAWWVNGVGPDGRHRWPNVPEGTFAATGYHNNRLFVIPEWNMVVVRLGLDGKDRRIDRWEFAKFLSRIGRAIEN
jgi:CubicO group peptidase (beta-lactamase class C family)